VFQGAEWHERETTDFYGITFAGNPNPIPLLLIPEMKGHPLQKDDGARALLTDLLPACEIVRAASGFDLLTPKAESGEATPA
jgi:NADH-quinone oxidoreductase subunit C